MTRARWLLNVQRDRHNEPRPNLFNAMVALREDPRFSGLFCYDEMLRAAILDRQVPGALPKLDVGLFKRRPISDTDVAAIQELLQTSGLEKIGKDIVHQAVDLRAHERQFHPIRDYLSALRWDNTSRVACWLTTYLGAENTEYHRRIGQMFLVEMVARIYQPGSYQGFGVDPPIDQAQPLTAR